MEECLNYLFVNIPERNQFMMEVRLERISRELNVNLKFMNLYSDQK